MHSNTDYRFSLPAERVPLLVVTLFLLLFLLPTPVLAISDLLVGAFIDDGVSALARGGLEELPRRQQTLDFNAPLFLNSDGKFRIETGYEHQRTVRIYSGRWAGTHAWSDRLESAAAAPFSLFDGRLKGSAAAGYGWRSLDALGENDGERLKITDQVNLESWKGGLYLQAVDRLFLGVSLISDNLRQGLQVPVEAEVAPLSFLRVGYKHSYLDNLVANFNAVLDTDSASLTIKDLEEINELYLVVDYPEVIYLRFANELKESANRRVEGKLYLPWSLYLTGDYARRDYAGIDEEITVNGSAGGKVEGNFFRKEYRVGTGAVLGERWTVEANYRHQDFSSEGGGVASSRAVTSFWPSLLLGNYNYLYFAELSGDQYHLGGEYRGERFSFGLGMQYLDLKPQANLDYWRSVLFGLGKTGAGNLDLTFDRVQMLFFSLGLGYRWKNTELRYAFGQFVPISLHDTSKSATVATGSGGTGSAGGGTGGGGGGFFSSVGDKFTHNPGGNIQRVLLTITF
ncbi:MAG TPA: hypothetical protein VJ550_16915 [Geomonas sp.]|nr:hypothetical protein [Geomonas sp.]